MSFPVIFVANKFLEVAGLYELDPLKLQKLIYFAHGWHLANNETPLIKENFEAWPYGPVVPELYESTKSWGSSKIDSYLNGGLYPKQLLNGNNEASVFATTIIRSVWSRYWKFSGLALSQITHLEDSPWTTVRKDNPHVYRPEIPNDLILSYFKSLMKSNDGTAKPK
ncbi:MAG: DUF4065 domain-containing protein [Bacteroidetes bacterium]|nr:DUF4065 domain-containing protein [Bacteroidota bacterium]